jgi:tetratricopeptide (TPR) repeat protein
MEDLSDQPFTAEGMRLRSEENEDADKLAREAFASGVAAGERSALHWLAAGLVEQGGYEEAFEILRDAVDSGRHDLAGFLADIADDLGEYEAAERYYGLAVGDGDVDALNDFAVFLSDQGRFDEAVSVYERAIEAGDTLAPGGLVTLYAETPGFLRRALELGEQFLDEGKPNTFSALAGVYTRLGRLDEAEGFDRKAIELDAPRAHTLLGHFLRDSRGDLEGAEMEFRLAQENDEPNWGYNLGLILLDTGREQEAFDVLKHSAEWGDLEAGQLLDTVFDDEEFASGESVGSDRE